MAKKMNRRTFILSALISGISLYIGTWWLFKVVPHDTTDMIVALVQKKLNYLQIDEAGLRKFSIEYGQNIRQMSTQRLIWLGIFSPLYVYTDLLDSTNVAKVLGEEAAQMFLLSSDFFSHGADETRVVEYVGLYDPYTRPCANPFAKFED